MSSASNSPPPPEAWQSAARLLLKTGSDDRTISFYPSLFQLIIESGGVAERVDLGYAGSRLLERLLRVPGEVVPREDLMGFAWPDRVVGQGSLNQQIYSLRQIFCDEKGRDIIQTLPRRGYQFNPSYVTGREFDVLPAGDIAPAPSLPTEPAAEHVSTEALTLPEMEAVEPEPQLEAEPEPKPGPGPGPGPEITTAVVTSELDQPSAPDEPERAPAAPLTQAEVKPQHVTRPASIWSAAALFVVALLVGLGISASIQESDRDFATREVEHGHVTMTLMAGDAATLDVLERDSETLLARIATLSQRPADLALDRHDGYFKLLCQRTASDGSWLMFHQSQLDKLADEQLVQCLL